MGTQRKAISLLVCGVRRCFFLTLACVVSGVVILLKCFFNPSLQQTSQFVLGTRASNVSGFPKEDHKLNITISSLTHDVIELVKHQADGIVDVPTSTSIDEASVSEPIHTVGAVAGTFAGKTAPSSIHQPLQTQWKLTSSFGHKYQKTKVDTAWAEIELDVGDRICVNGDGYAGFEYPEGPPSFIMDVLNGRSDRLIHFNPRRGHNVIVVNHCLKKKWGPERRTRFPNAWKQHTSTFQLCLLLLETEWRFELNDVSMTELPSYPLKDKPQRNELGAWLHVWIEVTYVVKPRFLLKQGKGWTQHVFMNSSSDRQWKHA